MDKIQIDLKSSAANKGKNRIFLPPIQNFGPSGVELGSLTCRSSDSCGIVIGEGKELRRAETMREGFGENSGKRGGRAPELIRFEKLSIKLGRILEEARVRYDIEDRRVKDGERLVALSPVFNKSRLNKYTIRSKLFKQTQDWVPVV